MCLRFLRLYLRYLHWKESSVIVEATPFQISEKVKDIDLDAIYLETLPLTSLTIEIILIALVREN